MLKGNKRMPEIIRRYDENFKKDAVKLSYASPRSVKEVATELGIKKDRLYAWRKKYTIEGEKTWFAMLDAGNRALRFENAELKMERDMLKKATAYFANLHN